MKNVSVYVARVLATIALVASSTVAFAGPGTTQPAQQIKFAPSASSVEIAGPGTTQPAQQIKFAPSTVEIAGPGTTQPAQQIKFASSQTVSLS